MTSFKDSGKSSCTLPPPSWTMGFLSLPVTLEINYYVLQLTILTLCFGCKTGKNPLKIYYNTTQFLASLWNGLVNEICLCKFCYHRLACRFHDVDFHSISFWGKCILVLSQVRFWSIVLAKVVIIQEKRGQIWLYTRCRNQFKLIISLPYSW